ncbi:MAG: helix-turn-helix domain-containing protein [Hyphomicrobiales bacterium]
MPTQSGRSKRQRLEDAAAQLFWSRGFAATSIADLAKQADVPVGNVYYYFKSKRDLADAVADMFIQGSQVGLDDIETRYPSGTSNPQRLAKDRVSAFFEMLEKSHMSRAKAGCPIARSVADFAEFAPSAARKSSEALTMLTAFLGRELTRAGHPNGMIAAQQSIALWQGAIVLAHGAADPQILMRLCAEQRDALLRAVHQGA